MLKRYPLSGCFRTGGGTLARSTSCLKDIRNERIIVRMDRMAPLLNVLMTPLKQRVLSAALLQPERSWYLQELAKHLGVSPSSVQHELRLFAAAGLLTRTQHGNRVYYQADRTCPIFAPLSEILTKTSGLLDVVRAALKPAAGQIDLAFVYGSVAAGEERSASDIDLMIVGAVSLSDIVPLIKHAEDELGREINPSVYTSHEFQKKVKGGHHFLTSVLQKELLFVHGTADDLAKLTRRTTREAAQNERSGVEPTARRRRTGSKRR